MKEETIQKGVEILKRLEYIRGLIGRHETSLNKCPILNFNDSFTIGSGVSQRHINIGDQLPALNITEEVIMMYKDRLEEEKQKIEKELANLKD